MNGKIWEFLFIDVIPMTPYQMFSMIESHYRQLKNSDELFGNLNVIVCGDLLQLPSVATRTPIYKQPARYFPAVHLWRTFNLAELTENIRQQRDTTFADLLNALRVAELRPNTLTFCYLRNSLSLPISLLLTRPFAYVQIKSKLDGHNNAVLNEYRAAGTQIFKILAKDVLLHAQRNVDNANIDKSVPKDDNKTGELLKELEIFVDARVMLRANINIEKVLVNGAMGNTVEIVWPLHRRNQMCATDIPSVRIAFRRDGIHFIEPRIVEFTALHRYGNIQRRQLP
uniref:ATP-dependent DNA helicase n=1 Tax=Diabrotica virgifera virgifera TaxID=50390 RepID=A0A6P7G6S3_DIAVI